MSIIKDAGPIGSPTSIIQGPKPIAPQPLKDDEYRELDDIPGTRRAIYDGVLSAAKTMPALENSRHRLRLTGVNYIDPEDYNRAAWKKAILSGETLGRRLRGTWVMEDVASGKELDRKTSVLASVPYLTNLGTYIHNGNQYTLGNQMRLRPGVFSREKENGEIEAHANVLPGKGFSHRYFLDPEKQVYYMRIKQAKVPMMPLLRAMGATDKELREAWGPEIFAANYQHDDPASLQKLYSKVLGPKAEPDLADLSKRQQLAEAFAKMEVDPEVMKRTLGIPSKSLDKDTLLATTKKLLAISRKEAEVDDRDAMPYQNVMGPEDLFSERISKDYGRTRQQAFWKASFKGNLQGLPSNLLGKQLEAALLHSGLGQAIEEINPAEITDKQTRISRMGEGGIPSLDAVPEEARNVQPSHFAFVDPLRTPESFRVGVDMFLTNKVRRGKDGRLYAPFKDAKTGKEVYKSPQDLADLTVAFSGQDPEMPRQQVMRGGKMGYAKPEEVDLIQPHHENTFSKLGNLIPLKSTVKGQRVAMAARMFTQALPLSAGEAPLVQSGVPEEDDVSFEDKLSGAMGAVRAKGPGTVRNVTPDGIEVAYDDGTTETHELYNNFPFNRKSVVGSSQILIKRSKGVWRGPIAEYEWQEGDLVQSIDPGSKRSAWLRVLGYTQHKNDKQLLRVTTDSGRSVVVTEDHSLMTMGEYGQLTPVYPADCEPGLTRVPVAMLPSHDQWRKGQETSLDPFGLLIGLYLAEGHCPPSQPGLINISVQPADRVKQVLQLLRDVGVENPYQNGGNVCGTDHTLAQRLLEFGHLAHNKKLASWVLATEKRFRLSVLVGYMGGDGNLWADSNEAVQVTGVSVSKLLRDGMVDLLLSLGIMTTLFDAPRRHLNDNWRDGYGFRVISSHLDRLPRWFFYTDRELALNKFKRSRYRASSFDLIPVPGKAARKLLYSGFSAGVPSYVYKTANLGAVSRFRLTENCSLFGKWAASDVMWDLIVSIAPAAHEETVYDLCVEGSEAFAVNGGLVVHNTYIHNTPTVQPGQRIEANGLLARSNYTDERGGTALGTNLRSAYIPFKGLNFEDAVVISESAAKKKLKSEHMYQQELDWGPDVKNNKREYTSLFPGTYKRAQLEKLDDDGVVLPGTVVEYGDPIILGAKQKERSHNRIHRKRDPGFADVTVTWKHHEPGEVTDVVKGKNGPVVLTKATMPMQVGDKLSGRYGDKGVVARVVPDDQMPHDKDGNPFEILLNPAGVISRTNPGQEIEAALGRLAQHTGKPIKVKDFDKIADLREWAEQQLATAGLNFEEEAFDPETGQRVRNPIAVGPRFFMKLHHTAEGKGQGRGSGGYTLDDAPAKGGESGSKRISMLDTNALLSHGATQVLRDAGAVRGQRNEQYWMQFLSGHTPVKPKVPLVYEKFVNQLKAAGINVVPQGGQMNIMALTDKDIDEMAGKRFITKGDTVNWKSGLKPIKGGLFDPELTGGHNGKRWAAIPLAEPMPNPVMEEPIRRVLGLTRKQFENVLSGKESLLERTGPQAITKALSKINLDRDILTARAQIKGSNKGERDRAVRRLGYLKSAKALGIHPKDWILNKAPVLPPAFRPISVMSDNKLPLVSDPNYLYQELLDSNSNLENMKKELGDDVGDERLALYNSFKAVTGLGSPLQPKLQEKGVKGILKGIFGSSPKFGTMQRKLISSTVDNVGRAVITPNPDLDMDQVGIPESKAWEVYKFPIARRLRRKGLPARRALREVKERTPRARDEMLEEMKRRPVIINRAPVLHKFGIMAFYPQLVKGDTMQISPLVVGGFGADFDGDAMQYHLPSDEAAVQEAIDRLLPSRSLLSPADFKTPVHKPTQEYAGGLYEATAGKRKRTPRTFADKKSAIAAWQRGEISVDDPIVILNR